jgi:hypothetical protein
VDNILPGFKPDKIPGYKPDNKSGEHPGSKSGSHPGNQYMCFIISVHPCCISVHQR